MKREFGILACLAPVLFAFGLAAPGAQAKDADCWRIEDADLRNLCMGRNWLIRDGNLRAFSQGRPYGIQGDNDLRYLQQGQT